MIADLPHHPLVGPLTAPVRHSSKSSGRFAWVPEGNGVWTEVSAFGQDQILKW